MPTQRTNVDEGMDDDSESTQSAAAMESFRRTMDVLSELHVQDTRQHGNTLQDDVDLLAKHWRNFGYYKDNVPPPQPPYVLLPHLTHSIRPNPHPNAVPRSPPATRLLSP